MEEVAVVAYSRHEHSVDVDLTKKVGNERDDRGDVEIFSLSRLTLRTSLNEPTDVGVELRPPETKEEMTGGGEDSLMSEFIVSIDDEPISSRGMRDEMGISILVLPEETTSSNEEVGRVTNELFVFVVREIGRVFESFQEAADNLHIFRPESGPLFLVGISPG